EMQRLRQALDEQSPPDMPSSQLAEQEAHVGMPWSGSMPDTVTGEDEPDPAGEQAAARSRLCHPRVDIIPLGRLVRPKPRSTAHDQRRHPDAGPAWPPAAGVRPALARAGGPSL